MKVEDPGYIATALLIVVVAVGIWSGLVFAGMSVYSIVVGR